MEKVVCSNVMELWANKYSEVQRWLTHLQKKEESALFLYRFCEWAHKTPPQLLALKERDATEKPAPNLAEKLLDEFVGADLADFKPSKKFNTAIAVKSFYKWSYRALEKAAGVMQWEKSKAYHSLSKESLRKLYNRAANPRDRALIPFICSTAIAKESLINLTWGHLEPEWENKELPCISIGSELLKGHGKGKYKGVRQITFLTPEAKLALRDYRDWIQEKLGRKLNATDRIWLSVHKPYGPMDYAQLGNVLIAISGKAKVPFTAHDGRRWLTTALEQIGLSPNWNRVLRGRKVSGSENPYSRPAIEQLRAKFKEAAHLLEFTSETPTVSKEVEERLLALEDFKKTLTPEQIAAASRAGYKFRKKVSKPEKDGDCEDGEHCQQIVNEENLASFLAQNWRVVATLPSGKIVIES